MELTLQIPVHGVYRSDAEGHQREVPMIVIEGDIYREVGFLPGTEAQVTVGDKKLTITPIEHGDKRD